MTSVVEFVGGKVDGERRAMPEDEPPLVISFQALAPRLRDTDDGDVPEIILVQYLREKEPRADNVWRYRYVPPPPQEVRNG